ncbi:VOC family protein [Burkholderia multivorans]|uniref:VOC family protein n=1 Tax=Burkholderia TaxID=32008 RepID=UPI000F5F6520|nr:MULTISPECIES: VOC family protein [Burkholderia]MBY4866365.1 VOC family protein [Burkholderia anthina]MCO1374598.1 VOC family protein [Burkholderia multivorans]MCO1459849.1 VOC family protein [Burkholderia multivorans]MCO1459953.1 VOC family protein [Burkholderia multivorans]QSL63990.1 VOC family protein [Burkholderia multivorans]
MIEFKWDHLQLCSADAEATATWFARCLNAEIVRRPGRVDLRIGTVNLFITALPDACSPEARNGARMQGIDHFGVLVEDLDAAYAHLVEHGAEIVQPVTGIRAGVRGCFVRAPGEILVEVLERRPAEMTFN